VKSSINIVSVDRTESFVYLPHVNLIRTLFSHSFEKFGSTMTSKGISAHKVRVIMQAAAEYPMNLTEIFDENIISLMDNICASNQMAPEYLVTMLLPAIGHFVNGSQMQTNTGTPTNISFFTTIIGYPSVNKSSATEAILNACLIIEKQIGIKAEESRVNCSATVESLLALGLFRYGMKP
jgi:hypothetical protein